MSVGQSLAVGHGILTGALENRSIDGSSWSRARWPGIPVLSTTIWLSIPRPYIQKRSAIHWSNSTPSTTHGIDMCDAEMTERSMEHKFISLLYNSPHVGLCQIISISVDSRAHIHHHTLKNPYIKIQKG